MRLVKKNDKISIDDILKLINLSYSLFDNGLTLNNMARRLLLILLESLTIKNYNFKIGQGESEIRSTLKEEMKYLKSVSWRDEEMLKLTNMHRSGTSLQVHILHFF